MGTHTHLHELFIERRFADAIHDGRKTFEIRSLEHGIEVGDFLTFLTVDLDGNRIPHAIDNQLYVVTYQLTGWHVEEGYGVYSIVRSPSFAANADELMAARACVGIVRPGGEVDVLGAALEEVAQPCG